METWVAFRVDASQFVTFATALDSTDIRGDDGEPLKREAVVDHDLCYAYYFQDPYGNKLELDCYEHAVVKRELIEMHAITPVRFW